ncbi:MAG: TatD family hydrolase [Planctomycetota bacterium]
MNLIDTHCHLTFEQFGGDVEQVIQRSIAAGVTGWITVGTDLEDSRKAVELAGKFENMFSAVAIHPHEAKSADQKTIAELKELTKNKKVVAIGETGLDYHYDFSTPQQQRDCFIRHLEIAAELNLPVIIHSREAFDETLKILEINDAKKVVFHCFSGSAEQAKVVLDKGWFISLTGVVTFKNANNPREVAKLVPLDRLMIETDAPYMSPEPMRKQKVNEPAMLIHTAGFIAELRGMELEDFAKQITATTRRFFSLSLDF